MNISYSQFGKYVMDLAADSKAMGSPPRPHSFPIKEKPPKVPSVTNLYTQGGPSTLSKAGKRAFGNLSTSMSPVDGSFGGNLSTLITPGITEDLSSFFMPSKGAVGSNVDFVHRHR